MNFDHLEKTWFIVCAVWIALCFCFLSDWAQVALQHVYEHHAGLSQFNQRYVAMDQQRILFLLYTSLPGLSWLVINFLKSESLDD